MALSPDRIQEAPPRLGTLLPGPVRVAVTDIDRAVAFYQDVIGLRLHRRDEGEVAMGDGVTDVVALAEEPAARQPHREAGLYHFCLLFPTREELARVAVRVATTKTPISGASDHGTHEAIYLPDPDGNGLELAADRPSSVWPDLRDVSGYTGPARLDLEDLLATVAGEPPSRHVEPGVTIGHLHLHVGDIEQAIAFYRDIIGLELMVNLGTAAFLSEGDYHHRLGLNVWRGPGVGAASSDAVGLREWTLVLADSSEVDAVRARLLATGAPVENRADGLLTSDPWNIPLAVRSVS